MRLFSSLYERVMRWSRHRHAHRYLAALSFAESSFFPIAPDVILAPMVLAAPHRAWRLAALTTLFSVIGGVLGYLIGYFAFDLVEPLLREAGYYPKYLQVREWFDRWGFWAVFLAGFSPIPYKIFTISAGVIGMNLFSFFLASSIGRGARFFLVAAIVRQGGPEMEENLHRYIDRIGWITVVIIVALMLFLNRT